MYKVGIVGVSRGKRFVSSFEAHPDMKVTALCDLDAPLLAEVGAAFELPDSQLFQDYDAFLGADMDIVMIATPIPLHTEQTVKALESGRHVLCEQTVAYTVEECERTLEAVKRSGRVYMMAENYCYFHYVLQWKEMIAAGRLGEIHYAEGEYIHEITEILEDPKTGEFYWRADRPPIWYCAHTLGPLLTLMDDRVVRATGLSAGLPPLPGAHRQARVPRHGGRALPDGEGQRSSRSCGARPRCGPTWSGTRCTGRRAAWRTAASATGGCSTSRTRWAERTRRRRRPTPPSTPPLPRRPAPAATGRRSTS